MNEPLRILILEDNPTDAELVQFELEDAGIAFTAKVVMTEAGFVRELQTSCPDLILADYNLPNYNGALALAEAKRRCPDVPFILVTGAIGEDRAVEILTRGAKDYVMKSRLNRLAPAVQRAYEEAKEHRARFLFSSKTEAILLQAHAQGNRDRGTCAGRKIRQRDRRITQRNDEDHRILPKQPERKTWPEEQED